MVAEATQRLVTTEHNAKYAPPEYLLCCRDQTQHFCRVNGWIFWAWGKTSEEVHSLVQRLAKARLERQGTLPAAKVRRKSREAKLASLVADIR